MSSDLNNTSADSNGTPYSSDVALSSENLSISTHADNLIAYFSTIIKSKIPVTEQDIDPAISPELDNIQVETSKLPDQAFQAFTQLFRLGQSHQFDMKRYRLKAQKSEPIPDDMFEEKRESLMAGGYEIFNKHRAEVSEHVEVVNASEQILISRIRRGHNEKENTQHQLGRLDAVKDDIVPQMSNLFAPVETAAKVGVSLTACNISQTLDQRLTELEISDGALRGEAQVIIKTRKKLEGYLNDQTDEQWMFASRLIYPLEPDTTAVQQIDLATHQISQFISPIGEYLGRWNDKYGSGITVIREVDDFCDVVPKIIGDIERIFEAKQIIKSSHQAEFGTTVYNLGLTIFEYLRLMKDNFKQKTIDPAKHRQFLQVVTLQFTKTTVRLNDALCTILSTHSSKRKSEKAEENRLADDRCFEDDIWKNKTLVKPSEVRSILKRVERAVDAISYLANSSGTGKIMGSIRGDEIERAVFKLDISIDSLRRLDRILGQDVEAGLERLGRLLIEQEPKARAGHIRSLLRKFLNHHKR